MSPDLAVVKIKFFVFWHFCVCYRSKLFFQEADNLRSYTGSNDGRSLFVDLSSVKRLMTILKKKETKQKTRDVSEVKYSDLRKIIRVKFGFYDY